MLGCFIDAVFLCCYPCTRVTMLVGFYLWQSMAGCSVLLCVRCKWHRFCSLVYLSCCWSVIVASPVVRFSSAKHAQNVTGFEMLSQPMCFVCSKGRTVPWDADWPMGLFEHVSSGRRLQGTYQVLPESLWSSRLHKTSGLMMAECCTGCYMISLRNKST